MVDITDITTGTPNGTGYFDKFMDSINSQLDSQFKLGRLQGKDYANVYLGSMQTALAQAVAYVGVVEQVTSSEARRVAEVALLEQRALTEQAQILDIVAGNTVLGTIGKQKALHQAQTAGFARDAEQKAVKIMMDSWGISKSVSHDAIDAPDGARNDDIEDLIIKLRQGIGITESIYKFNADAGNDQTVVISSYIQLDGTGSTSPTDLEMPIKVATWAWTVDSVPNTAEDPIIINEDAAQATIADIGIVPGDYVFRLTIESNEDTPQTDFDTVTITVE
jgi:hypothetical protein